MRDVQNMKQAAKREERTRRDSFWDSLNGPKYAVPAQEERQTILLVEDDPYVAKYIRKRLIVEGFEVSCVSNGAQAMEALSAATLPDLIISDLRMPEIDGMELLQRLRDLDRTASTPFILLSGSATVTDRIACLEAGASDYLSKPIDGAELAARVRVHLRHTLELRRLRREARFDPLTGAFNRRGSLEALQRETDRCSRSHEPMTLMLIDADEFKSINDTFGHSAGDEVLIEIAASLRECLRLTDVVGRMGGDEFMVGLPGVDEVLALQIKERIQERIAQNTVPESDVPIGVSVGLVTDTNASMSLVELFDAADRAMYLDKAARRSGLRIVPNVSALTPEDPTPSMVREALE